MHPDLIFLALSAGRLQRPVSIWVSCTEFCLKWKHLARPDLKTVSSAPCSTWLEFTGGEGLLFDENMIANIFSLLYHALLSTNVRPRYVRPAMPRGAPHTVLCPLFWRLISCSCADLLRNHTLAPSSHNFFATASSSAPCTHTHPAHLTQCIHRLSSTQQHPCHNPLDLLLHLLADKTNIFFISAPAKKKEGYRSRTATRTTLVAFV